MVAARAGAGHSLTRALDGGEFAKVGGRRPGAAGDFRQTYFCTRTHGGSIRRHNLWAGRFSQVGVAAARATGIILLLTEWRRPHTASGPAQTLAGPGGPSIHPTIAPTLLATPRRLLRAARLPRAPAPRKIASGTQTTNAPLVCVYWPTTFAIDQCPVVVVADHLHLI